MADLIIDVYRGSKGKCLAIGHHRISVCKAYVFLEKVESYECDTKDILSCIGTVVTEPKRGHWEDSSNGWMCSACCRDAPNDYNFCPNCGALMLDGGAENGKTD